MKKFLSVILATVLIFSLCAPVLAKEDNLETYLWFLYDETPEPKFTVTIVTELDLEVGHNPLPITVAPVQEGNNDFGNKFVSITVESTQAQPDTSELVCLDLWDASSANPYDDVQLHYLLFDSFGTMIDQRDETFTPSVIYKGTEVAVFDDYGTQYISIYVDESQLLFIDPDVKYTGHIVFGIKLVDM